MVGMGTARLCLILMFTAVWCRAALSAPVQEVEPNSTSQQAQPIPPDAVVSGVLDDGYDYYRLTLPAPGKVTVTLSGLPQGASVQLGAGEFGNAAWEESNGAASVTLTFDAVRTTGIVWVMPRFAGSACGSDWCVGRFTATGPYHVTVPSPSLPRTQDGVPVLEPARYTLTLQP